MGAGADPHATNAAGLVPSLVTSSDRIAEVLEGGDVVEALRTNQGKQADVGTAARLRVNRLAANASKAKEAAATPADIPARPVFISFRVREARPHACALKRALQAQGVDGFCSETDIPPGADWVKTIFAALAMCKVMVVLASEMYGSPGTDVFATYEELVCARKEVIPIYLVKMAPKVKEIGVQAMLNTLQGSGWGDIAGEGDSDGLSLTPPRTIMAGISAMLAAGGAGEQDRGA